MGRNSSQLHEKNFKSEIAFMISRDELMHHRLQAWLRENKCEDLEYLGFYEDTLGVHKHWYRIADHEVTVDCIEDLELVDAESEPL